MAKKFVIVESPAKARTIAGFLGDDYVVESSIGHIRDLPRNATEIPEVYRSEPWARLAVDVDNDFKPIYVVPADKKAQVRKLKAALKGASELYLATDEDREGEAIAWHLLEELSPRIPVKRMVFHEITKPAIAAAIEGWRELDRKLVDAQEARRILDRLVGWEVSSVLWKKVMPKLSAGRVQSVATRLVVERERSRMAFHAASWWDLEATLVAKDGTFKANLMALDGKRVASGRDFDAATGALNAAATAAGTVLLGESAAASLVKGLTGQAATVASVESKEFKQSPGPPFITSTLQQEAGRKLRFGPARTMQIAQRLYENGYITYMRTDSINLSSQAIDGARAQAREMFGPSFVPEQPRTYKSKVKNAQEAHEAIRPAGEKFRTPDQLRGELAGDELRLYDLIWTRTIACQMSDARGRRVSVKLDAPSSTGELATFSATGRTIEFAGYLRVYVEGSDDPDGELEDREIHLPPLVVGDALATQSLEALSHNTQPPARFTEASLVKELEAKGIGRPSTYASVIQTIQDRGYAWKKGTALVPSWTAFSVTQLLERHFSHLVDYDFTARMEEDLDLIALGERESAPWLHSFYFGNGHPGLKTLAVERLAEIDAREVNSVLLGADENGESIVLRVGRYGPYLQRGEDKAPAPDGVAPDEFTIEVALAALARGKDDGRILGIDPESGLEVIAKDGRFGPYVQLGERDEDKPKHKPQTSSLLKTMSLESITLADGLQLLSLPRIVGVDSDGQEISALNGRYGPYLKRGTDSRSLNSEEEMFTITLQGALEVFAQPKRRGRTAAPLSELGAHPTSGAPVNILEGRFGPYVTDGTTNASLPRGADPTAVTMEEALALIQARIDKGPSAPRRKKAATKKSATKKAAAKKPAKKKATAKKVAKKPAKKAAGIPASKPANEPTIEALAP